MGKIITFSAIKGGVGKTSISFNFGDYLASKNLKVLFIDLDNQCNLTTSLNVYDGNDTGVINIFTNDEETQKKVKITPIYENVDLIAGSVNLSTETSNSLTTNTNKNRLLFIWLYHHQELINKYDVIIIDTHPNFDIFTSNAIFVSDYVVTPLTPDELGFNAKMALEGFLNAFRKQEFDIMTDASYVNVDTFYIGNMFDKTSLSSKHFGEMLAKENADNNDVLAILPLREVFRATLNKHQALTKLMENPKMRHRYLKSANEFYQNFDKMAQKMELFNE